MVLFICKSLIFSAPCGEGGGYNQGGNYGQREQPWMHGSPGFQEQNWNGGGNYPNIDPRYFM